MFVQLVCCCKKNFFGESLFLQLNNLLITICRKFVELFLVAPMSYTRCLKNCAVQT